MKMTIQKSNFCADFPTATPLPCPLAGFSVPLLLKPLRGDRVTIGNKEHSVTEQIFFEDKSGIGAYRPAVIKEEFGDVIVIENELWLHLNGRLTDAYAAALTHNERYPNVFKELEDFIEFLDKAAQGALDVSKVDRNIGELFYSRSQSEEVRKELDDITKAEFLRQYKWYGGFRKPSVLEITLNNEGQPPTRKDTTFHAPLYSIDSEKRLVRSDLKLIYVAGLWKLVVQ